MRSRVFLLLSIVAAAAVLALTQLIGNNYVFFAGYVVLQFVVLAIAWNILGGYCGYVNFGSAAFFALGAYTSVFFHKTYQLPIPLLMLGLAVIATVTSRKIERSRLGYGFATIRDDELAAEAAGVPTLRLKLIATTLSGALMGMAGAPFPYYIGYLEPSSAFGLAYAVNSIAMPMIGGTGTWIGPLVGALLLGTIQQVATVTISSAVTC